MLTSKPLLLLLLTSFSSLFWTHSNAYPLSTQNRWIMDDSTGQRAKLVCGNWAGHLQPMLPEGLNARPLRDLVSQIASHNFNCVRLTYATYMWTRHRDRKVRNTLEGLDIPEVVEGISENNPWVLNVSHVQAFEAVVAELGAQNVKVLLDNHVSEPKWCCGDDDGNGFFHDRHFDPEEWVKGLGLAAETFSGNSAVVAMSLRNELHGPRQYEADWYTYMSQGAKAVHKANPNVLVVVSGLNYDTELQFLRKKPLNIDHLGKKLVFETHLYSWSGIGTLKLRDIWTKQPLNRICANSKRGIDHRAGFLTFGKNNNSSVFPLIFTEFGFDQEGSSEGDNRFLTCLQTYLVGRDMDWGLWALQGGYYLREDKVQLEETFGVFDASWDQLRFPNFTEKFQLLQRKIQDPTSNLPTSNILYHPLSGQCVQINSKNELELGSCESKVRWVHKDGAHHDQILLVGTKKCLTSTGEGNPAVVSSSSSDCQSNNKSSSWKHVSLSKLHLASSSMDEHGKQMLCLHKDSNSPRIVTQRCICVDDDSTCLDDPRAQWFQLVPTNV